jgi:hypothetical protein
MSSTPFSSLINEVSSFLKYINDKKFFVYTIDYQIIKKENGIILNLKIDNESYATISFILYNEYIEIPTIKILSVHSSGNQVGKFLFFLVIYCIVKSGSVSKIVLSNMTDSPDRAIRGIYEGFVKVDEEEMVYKINKDSLKERIQIFKKIKPIEKDPWSVNINNKLTNLLDYLLHYNNFKTQPRQNKSSSSPKNSLTQTRQNKSRAPPKSRTTSYKSRTTNTKSRTTNTKSRTRRRK